MSSPIHSDDLPPSANPASSLLQDLLREKKAENRRLSRAFDMDPRRVSQLGNGFDDRNVQSSPIPPSSHDSGELGHDRRSSTFGGSNTSTQKGMGMREMEQYVSKLNKQNFDLKLELFHRRQRNEALEGQLVKMQELEGDNRELQSINEDLVKELELRDVAVKEAVTLICELEAKVESMGLTRQTLNTPTRDLSSSQALPSSPPQPHAETTSPSTPPPQEPKEDQLSPLPQRGLMPAWPDLSLPPPSKAARRTPSFLHEEKPSTSALRSLYMTETNTSYISLNRAGSPQRDQDPDSYTLNSPRLSMLSESSFVSVYGKSPKMQVGHSQDLDIARTRSPLNIGAQGPNAGIATSSPDASVKRPHDQATKSPSERSSNDEPEHRSEKSFLSRVERMTKTQHRSSTHNRNEHLSKWLDESVSGDEGSPLRHRSNRQQPAQPRRSSPKIASNDKFSSIGELLYKPLPNGRDRIPTLPALTKPTFAGPEILPPTPDTMSTAQKASSSTQSIITEKSLNDSSRPSKNLSPAISDVHPHSTGTLGLDFENDIDNSDEEQQSVRVQQSQADSSAVPPDAFNSFPLMGAGSSLKAMRLMGDVPVRPPLATNIMFDGEGFESGQSSRAMSYPAPMGDSRRRSIAMTPTRPEPTRGKTAREPVSPKEWMSNTSATPPTPFPHNPNMLTQDRSVSSPRSRTEEVAPVPEPLSESKLPRTTSSRLKTLFRRSNSQSSQAALQNGSPITGPAERDSKIARPGTVGSGSSGGGIGRSASTRVFGGRKG